MAKILIQCFDKDEWKNPSLIIDIFLKILVVTENDSSLGNIEIEILNNIIAYLGSDKNEF